MTAPTLLHATCVSLDGKGVLLLGKSGSGKSDLGLRLIDAGAQLVSDDQVEIKSSKSRLLASPPAKICGMLEVRGVGILHMSYVSNIPIALAVKLVGRKAIERMPEQKFFDCLEQKVQLVSLHAFDDSTVAKIRAALRFRLHKE